MKCQSTKTLGESAFVWKTTCLNEIQLVQMATFNLKLRFFFLFEWDDSKDDCNFSAIILLKEEKDSGLG